MNLLTKIQPFLKLVVSLIGTTGITTIVAIVQGVADPLTWVTAIVGVLTSLSVYKFENKPQVDILDEDIKA